MTAVDDEAAVAPSGDDDELSLWPLVKAILYKRLLIEIRYPLNSLSNLVMFVFFYVLIFFGGQAVAGPAITSSLDGITVGFFLFSLASVAYTNLAMVVTHEAQWGTLERLYMSPYGFKTVMTVHTLLNVGFAFVWGFLVLVVIMALGGQWLSIDALTVVPLATLMLASVVGIGFLIAGLAILYKRIENLFYLVQFGLIGLIAAPVGQSALLKLLPVSHASYLTQRAMTENVRLWEFAPSELGLLVATSAAYLLVGFYAFHRATLRARRKGLMAHY